MISEDEVSNTSRTSSAQKSHPMTVRDRFAAKLGVSQKRKGELYVDLSRSTTLSDPAYWLQTLFAAGIATLGLALNSPAVIIGAMLISPLMGPILASGLALAAGDVILAVRSTLNLALSCLLAVGFAFILVAILPFKEITNEIAVRMHPTTLDLVVALFSGAIGSIAICKEVKGVVTSIPGVAIAVALMPPLCVVGYGVAVAWDVNTAEGLKVALGGGLLFLTNLVAITFMAMIVFLSLHLDSPEVKTQVDQWHAVDIESVRLRDLFTSLPGVPRVRALGTLPARVFMIFVVIVVILIPLSRSFNQLKLEISEQKKENRIRQVVSETWQKEFGTLANGETRSFLDQVALTDQHGKLNILLRVLTSKPLTVNEREQFNTSLAINLARPVDSIVSQVVEVPTAAAALKARAQEVPPQIPPSVNQLQNAFLERVNSAILSVSLPPPAQFVDYQLTTGAVNTLKVTLFYLSERDIESDALALIAHDVRSRLDYAEATVSLDRLPVSLGKLTFRAREVTLSQANQDILDNAARYLNDHPRLLVEITDPPSEPQRATVETEQLLSLIKDYLISRWQIKDERIVIKHASETNPEWSIRFALST